MIEFLSGKVLQRLPSGVVLDVNGVGYGLTLPLSAVANLPQEQETLSLWVYTRVREDALQLFGFLTRQERQAFEILIQISGIGPKVAIAILSTLSLQSLRAAVESRQTEILHMVPGIGKRTAEKILVELQAKLDKLPLAGTPARLEGGKKALVSSLPFAEPGSSTLPVAIQVDLKSALENLGFKEKDIAPLMAEIQQEYAGEDFSALLRKALSLVGKRNPLHKKNEAASPRQGGQGKLDLDQIF